MSGQQSRQFDATPGRFDSVGDVAESPRVSTEAYRPTAAQVRGTGQQMAALSEALGSFFNTANRTIYQVNQANERQRLIQIERENRALSAQAGVDHSAGKALDEQYKDRQAYAGAYQAAAADDHALDLQEGLRQKFSQLDLGDPSLNLHQVALDYYKENVGQGTGDTSYDSRLTQRFTSSAEALVQQFNEGKRTTLQNNAANELLESTTRQILSPNGITTPQFAELRQRALFLTHGDKSAANKLILTALSGQQNAFQGDAILRSMQELGLDREEADLFNTISGQVWKNQSMVKTRDAGVALQNYQMDLAAERSQYPHGVLPIERVQDFAQRALAINNVHGVGLDKFGVDALMVSAAKQKVRTNAMIGKINGVYGNADFAAASRANGDPSPAASIKHDFVPFMNQMLGSDPTFNATRDDLGNVRPLLTAESSEKFGRASAQWFSAFGMSPWDKDTSARMAAGLTGNNSDAIKNSYLAIRAARDAGVSRDDAAQFFDGNGTAEAHFNGLDMLVRAGIPIEQAAKAQAERYYDQRELDEASKTGDISTMIVKVLGPAAGKREDVAASLAKAQKDAILGGTDRKKWWGSVSIAVGEDDRVPLQGAMLRTAMLWRDSGYVGKLDDLAKSAVGGAGKWVVFPGAGGGLTAYRNPFGDLGTALTAPINHDGPLSTEKGYRPIMAFGAKVLNSAGVVEDTLATFRSDAEAAHKLMPGKFHGDADTFYVDRQGPDGLALMRDSAGMVPMFLPGEEIAVAGKVGKVPLDPKVAAEFFREHFQDSGFMFKQDGALGPDGQAWQAYYAPRVKVDGRKRDSEIAARKQEAPRTWAADVDAWRTITNRNPQ